MAGKRRGGRRVLILVLVVLLSGTLLFSLFQLYRIRSAYRKADEIYRALEPYRPEIVASSNAPEDSPAVPKPVSQDQRWLLDYLRVDEEAEAVDERVLQIRALQAQYPDAVGWITIPGTKIDYPFAMAEDNDYYLHRDLEGEYLYSGTLFLDYRCEKDLSGDNSIIYGHHMKNGTMFNNLNKFLDKNYLQKHSEIILVLPDRIVKARAFAALSIDPHVCEFLYAPATAEDHLTRIRRNAYVYFEPPVSETRRHYLTLSTCSFFFEGARTVVVAWYDEETAAGSKQSGSGPRQ